MAFMIKTLVDITNTNAKKEHAFEHQQQQNFLTLLQTISLRSNPVILELPSCSNIDTESVFNIKGKNNVWTMIFDFEAEASHSLEMLTNDLDLVPVIQGLNETVILSPSVFFTSNGSVNSVFYEISLAEFDK